MRVEPQDVFFNVEADGAGDRVGHHQRRRSEESLVGIRVNAPVEIAVSGQYCGGVQLAVDDLLLDHGIERARHAVARGAGIGHDAKAELFEFGHQARFLEIQGDGFGSRRQRTFHPRFALQAKLVGVARNQARRDHIARVVGVRAAGDRGDNHGAVRHQARLVLDYAADTACGQFGGRHTAMRVGRAGNIAHHRRQIELEHALVLGALQAIRPQPRFAGIQLDQLDELVVATGQLEVLDGLLVDVEHGRGGAVFGRHVGNRRPVAQRQVRSALAEELEVRRDDLLLAQKLGQRQHRVGRGDARLRLAAQLDADNVWQAHPRRAAKHHAFRFQAAHADGDHAQRVDHRGMRISAHQRIGKSHAVDHLDDRRHALQINLVQDAVTRRDHVDIFECLLGPVDEIEAVFVAAVFDGAVLVEGVGVEAAALHRKRMVDHELRRHHGIDQRRVAALQGDGVAQAGQVDQRGLAKNVMAHHAGREPWKVQVAAALDELLERIGQGGRIAAAHQVLGQYARGVGQLVVGARLDGVDRGARVEVIELGAR